MRLLYVGDLSSSLTAAWPAFFLGRGHDVHVCHIRPGVVPLELPGVVWHRAPRAMRSPVPGTWRASVLGVRRLVRRLRPDVVHTHQLWPSGYLVALGRTRPHIATAYGSEVLLTETDRQRAMVSRVARQADLITADSAHVLAAVQAAGAGPEHLRLVFWGVDFSWVGDALGISQETAADRLGLPAGRPIVLAPRGTLPVYRPEVVVRAAARILEELPEVVLVLACDTGPHATPASELETLAAHLGCSENIRFVPKWPHPEMPLVYRAAHICVSIPASDSGPTTVPEALALGLPVVVSDLPWLHEPAYRDARLDVVGVGDDEALTATIVERLRSPPDPDSAEANRRLVCEHFDRESLWGEFELVYQELARST